jgi:hypothetical protein
MLASCRYVLDTKSSLVLIKVEIPDQNLEYLQVFFMEIAQSSPIL